MFLLETSILLFDAKPLSSVHRVVVTVSLKDFKRMIERAIAINPIGVPKKASMPEMTRASLPSFVEVQAQSIASGPDNAIGSKHPRLNVAVAFPSGVAMQRICSRSLFKV